MRVHLRFIEGNEQHQKVIVFVDGRNCGTLTLGADHEACGFYQIVSNGCSADCDEFVGSGKPFKTKAWLAREARP